MLPVYNGALYLNAAIRSVLDQSFKNFELIIIDDGSTDNSADIISTFHDPRIRFYRQENQGLAFTLNRGIALSAGKYIARQDQDDLLFFDRLKKQIQFLDANPEIALLGTAAEIWVEDRRSERRISHPTDSSALVFSLLFDNYFVHSSVMFRRSAITLIGDYSKDKSRQPPEDYELWSRFIRQYKVANLADVLMVYRETGGSMSRQGRNPFLKHVIKISIENIAFYSGRFPDSAEVTTLAKLMHGDYQNVSRSVTFSMVRAVLLEAASSIEKGNGRSPQMLILKNAALAKLRYRYFDFLVMGLLGKLLQSQIGRMIKKWF